MNILGIIVGLVIILCIGVVIWGKGKTYTIEHSENQELFLKGTVSKVFPDGDYVGSVSGRTTGWEGKSFDKAHNTGFNRFLENGAIVKKYPFKTYLSKGLRDPEMDVMTIDYNQPGNPWWLRYVVDEVVNTGPETYLGKMHIRLTPQLVFSAVFFTLQKSSN